MGIGKPQSIPLAVTGTGGKNGFRCCAGKAEDVVASSRGNKTAMKASMTVNPTGSLTYATYCQIDRENLRRVPAAAWGEDDGWSSRL